MVRNNIHDWEWWQLMDICIDVATARNLELVSNIMRRNSKDTLFGVLNHTVTPMGSRLLRTNILQPSTDEALIRRRLDAVQELISQENLLFDIQAALKPVADLDHIIADIVRIPTTQDLHYTESKINNVIRLKILLAAVKTVANSLEAYNLNDLLGAILEVNFVCGTKGVVLRCTLMTYGTTHSFMQLLSDPKLGT